MFAVTLHREQADMGELSYLGEDLVCSLSSVDWQCLNSIPVQHTNSGGLEPPMNSSRAVKAALGSVLAVSPAGLCTTEQKGAPRFSDSHMGPALSWW